MYSLADRAAGPRAHRPGRVRRQRHRAAPAQRRTGCQLVLVEDDEHGQMDLEALERGARRGRGRHGVARPRPDPERPGEPAVEVGRLCRRAGVLFVLDACQSVGQLPLDVGSWAAGCSPATAASSCAARGTGFLYMHPELIKRIEPVMLDLHAATWIAPDRYEVRDDAAPLRDVGVRRRRPDRPGRGGRPRPPGWGIDAIAELKPRWPTGLRRLAESPASRCATEASSGAPSPPSRSRGRGRGGPPRLRTEA